MAKRKQLTKQEVFRMVQTEQYYASCIAGRLHKLLKRMHAEGFDKDKPRKKVKRLRNPYVQKGKRYKFAPSGTF